MAAAVEVAASVAVAAVAGVTRNCDMLDKNYVWIYGGFERGKRRHGYNYGKFREKMGTVVFHNRALITRDPP